MWVWLIPVVVGHVESLRPGGEQDIGGVLTVDAPGRRITAIRDSVPQERRHPHGLGGVCAPMMEHRHAAADDLDFVPLRRAANDKVAAEWAGGPEHHRGKPFTFAEADSSQLRPAIVSRLLLRRQLLFSGAARVDS